MAHSSMVLALGEACDHKLTETIDGLRRVMKTGYLSMFKHQIAYKTIHGTRDSGLKHLLDSLRKDFHQLVTAAKSDEAYHALYKNSPFVINDLIIMRESLDAINLSEGVASAIIVLQNVQNNLRLYLKDLHRAQGFVDNKNNHNS